MSIKSRIEQFIAAQNIKRAVFEKRSGLSNGYTRNLKENPSMAKIEDILNAFPELNRVWLLSGEGEMLVSNTPKFASNAELIGGVHKALNEDTVSVRFFDVTPTATFQDFCSSASEDPDYINIVPIPGEHLDDSNCVFEITGDSMAPQIQNHARILFQEIKPTKWHELRDCVVAIAYADRFVIKRIVKNELMTANYLMLASDNPDYPTRETVQLSDIRAVFQALRIISSRIV